MNYSETQKDKNSADTPKKELKWDRGFLERNYLWLTMNFSEKLLFMQIMDNTAYLNNFYYKMICHECANIDFDIVRESLSDLDNCSLLMIKDSLINSAKYSYSNNNKKIGVRKVCMELSCILCLMVSGFKIMKMKPIRNYTNIKSNFRRIFIVWSKI